MKQLHGSLVPIAGKILEKSQSRGNGEASGSGDENLAGIMSDDMDLRAVIDYLPYPFYVIDVTDHTIKFANAATSVYGRLNKNMTCYALTHNRNKPCNGLEHRCPLVEVVRTKKPAVMEHIHYDADGNARYYEIHAIPVQDAAGNVVRMIETTMDVTESKLEEISLKESEEKYQHLAQASSEGIVLHKNGIMLEINEAMEHILGIEQSHLLGRNFFDFVHADYRDTAVENEKLDHPEPYNATVVKRDGDNASVEIRSKSFFYRGKKVRVAAVRDVTDRKKIEDELREQKDLLLKAFEQAPIGIVMLYKNGTFFFWNSSFESLTGYYKNQISHLSFEDIVYQDEIEKFIILFE